MKSFSSFENSCHEIKPTRITQDTIPISRSLTIITSAKFLLSGKVTYAQVPRLSYGHLWDSIILSTTLHKLYLNECFLKVGTLFCLQEDHTWIRAQVWLPEAVWKPMSLFPVTGLHRYKTAILGKWIYGL